MEQFPVNKRLKIKALCRFCDISHFPDRGLRLMKKVDLFRFQNLQPLLKIDGKMKYKCKSETFEPLTVWYCLRQEYSSKSKEI